MGDPTVAVRTIQGGVRVEDQEVGVNTELSCSRGAMELRGVGDS